MISHVLFDFFGTLVDYSASRTEQGYPRSYALLRAAGSTVGYAGFLDLFTEVSSGFDAEADRSLREFSMRELGHAFLERAGLGRDDALVGEFVRTYLEEWNEGVVYHEALPALLSRLGRRFTLAVITNTHEAGLVPAHLERMGVADAFVEVVTSVEVGYRKPSPEIFRRALRSLGVEAERCVYVGDDPAADYAGARSAGLRALLIDPERRHGVEGANRLHTIFDVEAALG